jgi:integrase/recombinase XerD
MNTPSVPLKLRLRLANGSRRYAEPVFASNGKLKPLVALIDGKEERHDEGVYHLRYMRAGARVSVALGSDPQFALAEKLKVEHKLKSIAMGMIDAEPVVTKKQTDFKEAVELYLSETAVGKSRKTLYAYSRTLKVFAAVVFPYVVFPKGTFEKLSKKPESPPEEGVVAEASPKTDCKKRYMEQITRADVLSYINHLRNVGSVPRTVANYASNLKIFFLHTKTKWPLEAKDKVKYTEKIVSAYDAEEIKELLSHADQEESELVHFFLFTGAREQEVQFAGWSDVNFNARTYTVTEKLDLGFRPKDKEEGSIPFPDTLVAMLRNRRKRYPNTRLIFPAESGKPNGHCLRIVKELAFRGGMNCGNCYTKAGECCASTPTCKRFTLHKFRKSFATFLHHEGGVPVRTIQRYLRHSGLETTLKYLAASDDKTQKSREQINKTFAFMQTAEVAA